MYRIVVILRFLSVHKWITNDFIDTSRLYCCVLQILTKIASFRTIHRCDLLHGFDRSYVRLFTNADFHDHVTILPFLNKLHFVFICVL